MNPLPTKCHTLVLPNTRLPFPDDRSTCASPQKTVDQYFTGSLNGIQRANVRALLNAAIKELPWNPDRKFTVVEQVRSRYGLEPG